MEGRRWGPRGGKECCANCQDVADQLGDGLDRERHTEELIIGGLKLMEKMFLGAQECRCPFHNHSGCRRESSLGTESGSFPSFP